jgi:hypothetical protein
MEEPAQSHQMRAVQIQPLNRSSAGGSAADDVGEVIAPGKLLLSTLSPGIVEQRVLAGRRVSRLRRGVLPAIAPGAGIGEVRQAVRSSTSLGLDVVDRERIRRVAIRGATVFAVATGPSDDLLPLFLG